MQRRATSGRLAAVARQFPHQSRHQVAGQACRSASACSSSARASGDGKVGGAGHRIELMQVVGQHAGFEQALRKARQHRSVVVDAGQQHGLVQQRGRRGLPAAAAPRRWRASISAAMVGVHDDDQPSLPACKRIAAGPASTREGSTMGVRVWMRMRRNCGSALSSRQQSRPVARLPSDSGSPPLRMISSMPGSRGDMRQRCGPARLPSSGLVRRVVVVAAEAVAAMHGAGAGGDQQRAARVLLQQARVLRARRLRRAGPST